MKKSSLLNLVANCFGGISFIMVLLLFTGCTTTAGTDSEGPQSADSDLAEISHDGLVQIQQTRNGAVWMLPETDLSVFTRVAIMEPEIAFRRNWQSDVSRGGGNNRVSNQDMEQIIEFGQELFMEHFTSELEAAGFEISDYTGEDVLLIRPAILNLDISAPDPSNMNGVWRRIYTSGAGSATLMLELMDSMTVQTLVRAIDTRSDTRPGGWNIPRSRSTNVNDARRAFSAWSGMLVAGLESTRTVCIESKSEP